MQLVELNLNIEGRKLTRAQQDALEKKLALLLHEDATIVVRNLREEDRTGHAVLVFYVEEKGSIVPAPQVVNQLRSRLAQDAGLLELSVAGIQTTVCQNNCSGKTTLLEMIAT